MTTAEEAFAETIARTAAWEVAASIGAHRCLMELGTWKGRVVLCEVVTQGGRDGLAQHRRIVHGIESL